jgi:Uroporphyrinogen decarboxylase (URO-D)
MQNKTSELESLLEHVSELIHSRISGKRINMAKKRQADTFAGSIPDHIPMLAVKPVQETMELPNFNWNQQWYGPAKSLYMQLKDSVLPAVSINSDIVPMVRADTGVINCMSLFGVEYEIPEHTKPVVTKYVSKKALSEFQIPDDISDQGIMPGMVDHMQHHITTLKKLGLAEYIIVGHCDLQGPFDIAAMVRGHEIFTDMYEDPDFVHMLMQKCTVAYTKVAELCKTLNGNPPNCGASDGIWMENGLGRMCGDSDILVSEQFHREFIQPYQQKAFAAFGGGWFHYCGGVQGGGRAEGLHLHDSYAEIDELRALNFTTGGDWLAEMKRLNNLGKIFIGTVPRDEGQSLDDYFRKALSSYETTGGLIFCPAELKETEYDSALERWHEISERHFV